MRKITVGLIIIMSFALIISCSTDDKVAETDVMVGAPFHATFAAAQAEAQETGKDILIDFYTDW